MFKNFKWKPPYNWEIIKTIDLHTCGEPLRVFTEGLPEIKGNTILEKRKYFRDNLDYIRTGTMWEPRGHADMYGAVITDPVTPDGDFGTFFLHNEGYSTMCGHAMIALVTLVLETGLINKKEADKEIKIDAPPGRITAKGYIKDGKVQSVSFKNVPSFLLMENQTVDIPDIGKVNFDISFGGAFYAFVQANDIGLNLDPSNYDKLIDYGRKIKHAVIDNFEIRHPFEEDLSFLYGTIFIGDPEDKKNHSRNVCIFADGEVDRSPTGSGVSARAAIHHAKNELKKGKTITIESILGTLMDVKIVEEVNYGPYKAIIPEVTGTASITGQNSFYFDPDDPLKDGFILR
ncbi:proline racemase family protein [Bacteroidota bacterium]